MGDTILFWSDLWYGKILKLSYPQLFSFTINAELSILDLVVTQDNLHFVNAELFTTSKCPEN
jgi:hypothetical protein